MKKKIVIVGGGSCALFLACQLDTTKYNVAIYEKNATLGRKFLVAGDGGLNLTHSESSDDFVKKYSPHSFFKNSFSKFSNENFINWLNKIGIETYIGSSGRVFPVKGIKPIDVLNVLINIIHQKEINLFKKHEWIGFDSAHSLLFKNQKNNLTVKGDFFIYCMGGASWPVTGSDGDWLTKFDKIGIPTLPFEASNCAFKINWPIELINRIEGKSLKNCSFKVGKTLQLGEAILTRFGIEGGGIYPLSPSIRKEINDFKKAELIIDFKPNLSEEVLLKKLTAIKKSKNYSQQVSTLLNLTPTQLLLLKCYTSKEVFKNPKLLVLAIKKLKLELKETGPIDEAISSVGGIDLKTLSPHFELQSLSNHFVIGEMLNYDAPTGGYLLQSCFTMSSYLANYLNSQ